jgi:hypothetical protein
LFDGAVHKMSAMQLAQQSSMQMQRPLSQRLEIDFSTSFNRRFKNVRVKAVIILELTSGDICRIVFVKYW